MLAGPATAVLMIPVQKDWLAGGGIWWANGSDAEMWPSDIGSDFFADYDCSTDLAKFANPICPSAGYQPLHQYYSTWWQYNGPIDFEMLDYNLRKTIYVRAATSVAAETWVWTAHAATATLQDTMCGLYRSALKLLEHRHPNVNPYPSRLLSSSQVTYAVPTKVPFVRTACLAQDGLDFRTDNITVRFPLLEEYKDHWNPTGTNFTTYTWHATSITRDYLFNRGLIENKDSELSNSIFVKSSQIIAIPMDIWNHTASSLGLIFLLNETWPGNKNNISGSNVMVCSIDARWATAVSVIQVDPKAQLPHEYYRSRTINLVTTEIDDSFSSSIGGEHVDPPNNGLLTQIRLRKDWYDVFSPMAPNQTLINWVGNDDGVSQTALEKLLQLTTVKPNPLASENQTVYGNSNYKGQTDYSTVISTAVADSLSRCGRIPNHNHPIPSDAWNNFDWAISDTSVARTMVRLGMPKETFPKPDFLAQRNTTKQVMTATYYGYALSADNAFDYGSIVILLSHATLALLHCVRMIHRKEVYTGLHSIAEALALALKSPPPSDPILTNISSGIKSFDTLGSGLRLLVKAREYPGISSGGEKIQDELRFQIREGDDNPKTVELLTPKANVYY